jgi:hypothetical protein
MSCCSKIFPEQEKKKNADSVNTTGMTRADYDVMLLKNLS